MSPGDISEIEKAIRKEGFRNCLITGFVLVIIWAALNAFIPLGWWMVIINIGFLLLMIFSIGPNLYQFLKLYMQGVIAGFVTGIILALMIVVIRSIFLEWFGMI